MKKTVAFIVILLLLAFPSTTFAQDNEDSQALRDSLSLTLPSETDNPNLSFTFTDPTEQGVFLSIDGGEEQMIKSPYELPSLGIGNHKLKYRFTDSTESEVSYEATLNILPRPPQIATATVEDGKVVLTGKGLAAATVNINVSGNGQNHTKSILISNTGDWNIEIEGEFTAGIYQAIGYISKNGYGSAFSEAKAFTLEDAVIPETPTDSTEPSLYFTFASISSIDPNELLDKHKELTITVVVLLLGGIILGILLSRAIIFRNERKIERNFKALLTGSTYPNPQENAKAPNARSRNETRSNMSLLDKLRGSDDRAKEKVEEIPVSIKNIEFSDAVDSVSAPGIPGLPEELQGDEGTHEPAVPVNIGIDPYEDVDLATENFHVYDKEGSKEQIDAITAAGKIEVQEVVPTVVSGEKVSQEAKSESVDAKSFLDRFKEHDPDPDGTDAVVLATPKKLHKYNPLRIFLGNPEEKKEVLISGGAPLEPAENMMNAGSESPDIDKESASGETSSEPAPSMTEKLGKVPRYSDDERPTEQPEAPTNKQIPSTISEQPEVEAEEQENVTPKTELSENPAKAKAGDKAQAKPKPKNPSKISKKRRSTPTKKSKISKVAKADTDPDAYVSKSKFNTTDLHQKLSRKGGKKSRKIELSLTSKKRAE